MGKYNAGRSFFTDAHSVASQFPAILAIYYGGSKHDRRGIDFRARNAIQRILKEPAGRAYGDYMVQSASGRKYRVAMRGPSVFENFCSCADFAVNTLGTCKHIEGLLLRLHRRFGRSFNNQEYQRTPASLSLHYGDTLNVRLRLPAEPSAELRNVVSEYFDSNAFLRKGNLRRFAQVLEKLRTMDETAVVYSASRILGAPSSRGRSPRSPHDSGSPDG
jgi:predicted nucleic acid-binding Zn finger protein